MAATYTLIASNTLSTSAASVTFSAIPGTYTDLVLKAAIRTDDAGTSSTLRIRFNSDTASNYSSTRLGGDGSAAASTRTSNSAYYNPYYVNGNGSTSNTFSSVEIYIPSYTVSQNKPISGYLAQETNATSAEINATAGLWRNTAAITSLEVYVNALNFVSGSSFFLYGIKNS